jgi:hypothetical protein
MLFLGMEQLLVSSKINENQEEILADLESPKQVKFLN